MGELGPPDGLSLTTFEKLNLKDQREIAILNAPESFEGELAALRGATVRRSLPDSGSVEFALAFVTRQAEVDSLAKAIASKAKGDAVVWFAYPKGSSKKYKSEIESLQALIGRELFRRGFFSHGLGSHRCPFQHRKLS